MEIVAPDARSASMMVPTVVAADRLRALPLFAGLDDDAVELAASLADELSGDRGATVVAEDELGYYLYVVERGTADVVQDGSTIAKLCAGDLCGELGLLVTGRRTATVVATSPLTLLAYFEPDYRRLERRVPLLAGRIRTEVAGRALKRAAERATSA